MGLKTYEFTWVIRKLISSSHGHRGISKWVGFINKTICLFVDGAIRLELQIKYLIEYTALKSACHPEEPTNF